MIRLFEEQVRLHPERAAIRDPLAGREASFQEVDRQARRIAAKLIREGLEPGDAVLITASRGIGYIEAMLGILMAGGAYVPLATHYPQKRVDTIREDCGAKILVDDAFLQEAEAEEPLQKAVERAPEDRALIAYTSGSTGSPKGVVHDYLSLREFVRRHGEVLAFREEDVFGFNAPLFFIVGAGGLSCLAHGVTTVIVPDALRADPEGLASFIDEQGITVLYIPPKVLRYFRKKGSSLRTVFTGSERLTGIEPKGFLLVNCYGMTETLSAVTRFEVRRCYDNTPIGKPLCGVQLYLLDEEGKRADEGEICVAGHLGREYLNKPEQSAATFVPNPFRSEDGYETLLHTGDLGKRLPDGNFVYLNRKDWMVKINGQRVEPGEIEAEIRRLDGVRDAVVRDFTDAGGQVMLAAYYIGGENWDEKGIRETLKSSLPEYMIPAAFIRLEKFPVNANGKLDRGALPRPETVRRRAAYAAPENERQRKITAAYENTLGIREIGLDDDFFLLGGDSIKLMILQKELRKAGIERTSRDLFEATTPRALAEKGDAASALTEYRGREAASYPLTKAQMSVYLDGQMPGRETAYNNTFGLFLPEETAPDAGRLLRAAEVTLNRYPVLNTAARNVDGVPSLVPLNNNGIAVEEGETDQRDRESVARELSAPFALEEGPLCRAKLFHTPEGLYLVCCVHHIVADGTSLSLLSQGIAAAYNGGEAQGEELSSFALALYEAEHPEQEKADTEVFRKMLDEVDGETALWTDDDPSLEEKKGKAGVYITSLSEVRQGTKADLADGLAVDGLTEGSLFMAAYAYLLRMFCGQKEILFFAGENGRHDPALAGTVGMMVHSLPVFLRVDDSCTGRDFVKDVQERFHTLMGHDGADLAGLMGEYGVRPDNCFVYHGMMFSGVEMDGRHVPMEFLTPEESMASLTLHISKEQDGDYCLRFEYAAEKFREDTVRRMAEVYGAIVAGLSEGQKLCGIPLTTVGTQSEMDAWNETEAPYPVTDVVSLFRQAVESDPERTAVVFRDRSYTYRQTDEISERIAGRLRSEGIGKGDVVSVLIPRCEYMAIASLGVLKAGAAYQPLDPNYPSERLNFMMKDADCRLLIADESLLDRVAEYRGKVLLTKEIPMLPACEKLSGHPAPEDLFILLYTSGTTGVPKGVMLEHRNLANFCAMNREKFGLDGNARVAAYASYGFDACLMDIYPTLTSGAALYIVEEDIRLDLPALEEWFNRMEITHAVFTTQVGRQFYSLAEVKTLRYLVVGGEKLVPVEPREKGPEFCNHYGPTETTVYVTGMAVKKLYDRVPIGPAVRNHKLYVVDEGLRRLPPLVPGELLVAGRGVGRGYLNRPEATEKAFIPNPFCSEQDYDRVYRTGDRVRLLPDGTYDFLGRGDSQVKVRGYRIELSEVEKVIREFPGISDATVQAFEDEATGEKFIAAYVVSDGKVDVDGLNRFIGGQKPAYMIPAVTMQIDAIPLNQNQKVNRKALPKPERGAETAEDESRADNVLEEKLKAAVAEITGSGKLSLTVPLDQTGLTSIGVIRFSALLYKQFGVNIPTSEFRGASLLDIENRILSAWMKGEGSGKKAEEKERRIGFQEPVPLSAAQMGVYMECVKNPENMAYNMPVTLCFTPETDPEALIRAVRLVMKAHPSAHVHFDMVDSKVMAVANETDDVAIPVHEMTEEEEQKFRSEFIHAFRLNRGPLFSFAVTRTKKRVCLHADFHHLIFDGFTMDLFLRDLKNALSGQQVQEETADYADFTRAQQAMMSGDGAKEYDSYFAALFENYESPTQITPDLPKTEQAGKASIVRTPVSQADVERAVGRTGVSEAAFFLSALYYTAARLTNSDSVYLSTISSGRSDVRFSDTYGMFVNTLPLSSVLSRGNIDDYIRNTAEDYRQAIAHENYPFAAVASQWGFSVQLMYAYQRGIVQRSEIPGLTGVEEGEADLLKFPMFIRIVDDGDAPAIEIEYDDAKYSRELAEKIGRFLAVVVARFAEDGTKPLRGVSLLDEAEEKLVLQLSREEETVEIPDDTFFFTPMEKMAARYPDRTAVIAKDGSLTYREFDTITDRVANALIRRGAKPGGKALVLLPRTSRALIAFFGASKAGLGYIPFDPAYPAERVNMVIEDSQAQFVITDSEMLPRFAGKPAVDIEELLRETDSMKPRVDLRPENISYMIYTSGSTGRPKGVMLTHRNVAHYFADMPGKEMINTLRANCTVYCAITTLSFDVSVMEYGLALSHGMTLYFANEAECNDPDLLAERITETKADVISGTPSRMQALLNSEIFCEVLKRQVKMTICGGEKYPEKLMTTLKELVPHQFNIYGPSEVTISCNEHDLADDEAVSLGRPTPGVGEYIVDTDGNLLPAGLVGEVWIGGWGVGLGYNELPEMTEERFIPYRDDRIYKSGDYGRWMPDGFLEILGRKDHQIKLRGLRIELGEVDTVLAQQPGMKETAVKIEKINGIEHICAWFTNEQQVGIPELKAAMGKTLTPYMVPTAYMQMEKMPYTPNGKLDMKNLPTPEVFRGEGEEARSKAEKAFCDIFGKILNLDHVLATESFFDLGGTSLLVTQVSIEAGKAGYPVVFGDVFTHPTPRQLAELFEQREAATRKATDATDAPGAPKAQTAPAEGSAPAETAAASDDPASYDYTRIYELLRENTLEEFLKGEPRALGTVLLTGATGYLGIHVLHELLENTDSKVYCLVRGGKRGAEGRLKELLMYYFESPEQELFGNRILPVEGDITNVEALKGLLETPIDTVINCAASVKHFAADNSIEKVNVGGVRNLISFCLEKQIMFIQASTMSVQEVAFQDSLPEKTPDEHTLFFGQDLSNKYVYSKFLSDREILEAAATKGLHAKIMRYGNLAARHRDGEFQINSSSNSAMGNLRAYAALKCAPFDDLNKPQEFSPIDAVAEATVKLAATPEKCRVFHVLSDHTIPLGHVLGEMRAMGHQIDFVEREAYEEDLASALSDPKRAELLTSLMAYTFGEGERKRKLIEVNRDYTLQVLYRLGFTWPMTSWDYFRRFMGLLNGFGYFDESFDNH